MLAGACSDTINTIAIRVFYSLVGEENILYFGAATSLIAIVICLIFFDEKLDIQRLEKRGMVEWEDDWEKNYS